MRGINNSDTVTLYSPLAVTDKAKHSPDDPEIPHVVIYPVVLRYHLFEILSFTLWIPLMILLQIKWLYLYVFLSQCDTYFEGVEWGRGTKGLAQVRLGRGGLQAGRQQGWCRFRERRKPCNQLFSGAKSKHEGKAGWCAALVSLLPPTFY